MKNILHFSIAILMLCWSLAYAAPSANLPANSKAAGFGAVQKAGLNDSQRIGVGDAHQTTIIAVTPAQDIEPQKVQTDKKSIDADAPGQDNKYHGPGTIPSWYTPSMATDVLLSEGFEGGVLPAGWTDCCNTTHPWLFDNGTDHGPNAPHGGSFAAYFNIYDYAIGTIDSLRTPSLDFSTQSGNFFIAYWSWHSSGTDSVVVYLSEAGVLTRLQKMPNSSTWIQSVIPFSSTSTNGKIYFVGYSNYGSHNLYIDDVTVDAIFAIGACCYGDPYGSLCTMTDPLSCAGLGGGWSSGGSCPCGGLLLGDNCNNPLLISSFPYTNTQNTADFTNDYNAHGNDVVYQFTVTERSLMDFSLCNTAVGFDTWMGIWANGNCGSTNFVNFDDDECGYPPGLSHIANQILQPGTYYLDVEAYSANGTYILNITSEPAPYPPNDDCENAIPISENEELPFYTAMASFDGNGTCQTAPNVWYLYTASRNENVTISLCGSSYDTKLAVYNGASCDPIGALLGCNDDFCDAQSQLTVPMLAGNQYLIEVGGYGDLVGNGVILIPRVEFTNCPPVMVSMFAGDTLSFIFAADNPGGGQLEYTVIEGPGAIDAFGIFKGIIKDSLPPDTIDDIVVVCDSVNCDTCAFQIEVYPILPGPGPLVVDGFPRIWAKHGLPAVEYATFPRGYDICKTQDDVLALIYLKNIDSTQWESVRVEPEPLDPLIWIPDSIVYYGNIPPGASTPRAFHIVTNGSEIGTHPLRLHVTSNSGNFDITTWISTWETNISILDPIGGVGEGSIVTPFGEMDANFTAPEDTSHSPYFFNLTNSDCILHSSPQFYSAQWGDPRIDTQTVNYPTPNQSLFSATIADHSGSSIPGIRVQLDNAINHLTFFTDSSGSILSFIPSGSYTVTEIPTAKYDYCYNPLSKQIDFQEGKKVQVSAFYPVIPENAKRIPYGVPPNAKGLAGVSDKQKSIQGGSLITLGLLVGDALLAPETFGATLLSCTGAVLECAGQGILDDPDENDIYFVARAATPPTSDSEMTYQENLLCSNINYSGFPSFDTPYSVSVSWHYERITNANTYLWDSTGTFSIEDFLPIWFPWPFPSDTIFFPNPDSIPRLLVHITDPHSRTLSGGQVTVCAWITSNDLSQAFNQVFMADDGQAPDSVPNDGIYSAYMPLNSLNAGSYKVIVLASRSGFHNDENPPSLGYAEKAFTIASGGCSYAVGDANNSHTFTGLDVTYSVRFFKGGPLPPYSCECPPGHTWYVSGDVNGSCTFTGLDITYMVRYFKGGPAPIPCPDCPPAR